MPRISVDIDLTYLPLETDYEASRRDINEALKRIRTNIQRAVPGVQVAHTEQNAKLFISARGVQVKVEVNLTGRGAIHAPQQMTLCEKAQEIFDVFVTMQVVPHGQLYGGKICAALDRQHPRDLFDVKYLLDNEGFTPEVKEGFLYYLSGHARPFNELLNPNWLDQTHAMTTAFAGMSEEEFGYPEFDTTRVSLLAAIHSNLTDEDKNYLLSLKSIQPDWSTYDFFKFPAVAWKLENLQKLKAANPEKHAVLQEKLKGVLAQAGKNASP